MGFKSGKEVDNKVSEKEHDKEEWIKTLESDLESENENDPSFSPVLSDPTVTYKPRVPNPQAFRCTIPFQER